jgi:hypothetical protein
MLHVPISDELDRASATRWRAKRRRPVFGGAIQENPIKTLLKPY